MGLGKAMDISKRGQERDRRGELLKAARAVTAFIPALLFGCSEGIFSCYPLGIAFLAAVDKRLAAVYLGLMVSSLFSKGYAVALAIVYTFGFILRCFGGIFRGETKKLHSFAAFMSSLINAESFSEAILLRCAVSALMAFGFGLYRLVEGGFLYYDLFGLLTGTLLCPVLTLALAIAYSKDDRYLRYKAVCSALPALMLIYAIREYRIFGFDPASVAAFIASMWAASAGGINGSLRGCAVGLCAGLASGTDPAMLAAVGLCVGALWKLSRGICTLAATMLPLIFGFSTVGLDTLRTILPDALGAVTIFMPLSYYGLLPKLPSFAAPDPSTDDSQAVILEKKQADTLLRMNSLSGALGRLSEIIYTLSDRLRRPGIIDLKQICDSAFDDHCSRCSLSSLCLERECTSTLDARAKITTGLYNSGRVDPDTVPGWLRERCYNLDHVIMDIDRKTAELVEGLIKNDKTEAFAIDYESLSKLLSDSICENDAEYRIDPELTAKLQGSLKYMDMPGARAICWGSRRKQVHISGAELSRLRLGANELCRMTENIIKTRLTHPSFRVDGERVEVSMSTARRYNVESARATNVRESESANGDTALTFETREDYFYSMISDGMGSGREAAVTSKLCGVFVEQLLGGGNGKAITLEMLHGFLRSRPGECSATIDLVEIDLLSGKAAFVKSGAAPSFVLRGGNLYRLQSKTVPIGIMPALDAEQIKFELESGDVIVMLSDGVAQSLEDGVWLANMLTYEWIDDLQLMAEKILDGAAMNNARSDDMTSVLLKICDAPKSGFASE